MTSDRRKASGTRREQRLHRLDEEYGQLKAELAKLGYVLQGSVTERWMACGKATCACRADASARHGPYYQWSWKEDGRTLSRYLDRTQAKLARQWIGNNQRLQRLLTRLRALSRRAACLHEIPQK